MREAASCFMTGMTRKVKKRKNYCHAPYCRPHGTVEYGDHTH